MSLYKDVLRQIKRGEPSSLAIKYTNAQLIA